MSLKALCLVGLRKRLLRLLEGSCTTVTYLDRSFKTHLRICGELGTVFFFRFLVLSYYNSWRLIPRTFFIKLGLLFYNGRVTEEDVWAKLASSDGVGVCRLRRLEQYGGAVLGEDRRGRASREKPANSKVKEVKIEHGKRWEQIDHHHVFCQFWSSNMLPFLFLVNEEPGTLEMSSSRGSSPPA